MIIFGFSKWVKDIQSEPFWGVVINAVFLNFLYIFVVVVVFIFYCLENLRPIEINGKSLFCFLFVFFCCLFNIFWFWFSSAFLLLLVSLLGPTGGLNWGLEVYFVVYLNAVVFVVVIVLTCYCFHCYCFEVLLFWAS